MQLFAVSKPTVPTAVPFHPFTESTNVLSICHIALSPVVEGGIYLTHIFARISAGVLTVLHTLISSSLPEPGSEFPRPIRISFAVAPNVTAVVIVCGTPFI